MARLSRWGAPRRRRSSKADAEALAFVITAVVALASAGIYLIVTLVSAIASAKQRSRNTRLAENDSADRARFAAGETLAPPLPQPSEPDPFVAIRPVDPASFEYATSIEAEATAVFGAWAKRISGAPRDPREVIRRVDINRELVGRLESTVEGRRFVWRTAAASKARLPLAPQTPIDKLDPWNPPPALAAATLHGTTCRQCAGSGETECGRCGGTASVTCVQCDGVGKAYGYASNGSRRLMNCRACAKHGFTRCEGCTRGKLTCAPCQGSGQLQVWLEIDEKAHQDVQVEPDGHVTRAFRWGQDGVTASDDEIAKDARVVSHIRQSTPIDPNALPNTVPSEWRDQHWSLLVPRLRPGERVIDQRFTLLELHSVDVVYAVGPIEQTISLEGLRLLAPPASVDTAFGRRARLLRTAAWSLAAVPIVLALFYLARGAWFWSVETAILCGLIALASALSYVGISRASIPRRGAWLWLSATVVPLVAGLVVALGLEPDLDRARARALAGDFDGARAELGAAGDSPIQSLAAHDVQVAELLTIDDVDRASTMLATLEKANTDTRTPTDLTNARAHVYALQLRAADADLGLEDFDAARARLMALPQSERSRPEAKALLGKIDHASDQHALSLAEQAFATNDLAASDAREVPGARPEARAPEARPRDAYGARHPLRQAQHQGARVARRKTRRRPRRACEARSRRRSEKKEGSRAGRGQTHRRGQATRGQTRRRGQTGRGSTPRRGAETRAATPGPTTRRGTELPTIVWRSPVCSRLSVWQCVYFVQQAVSALTGALRSK